MPSLNKHFYQYVHLLTVIEYLLLLGTSLVTDDSNEPKPRSCLPVGIASLWSRKVCETWEVVAGPVR